MFELLDFIHSPAVSCLYFLPSKFAWLIPVHLLIFSPHISKFFPYYFFPILFHQIAPSCVPQKSAYIFLNALSTFYLSLDYEFLENKDSSVLFIFMSCSSPVTELALSEYYWCQSISLNQFDGTFEAPDRREFSKEKHQ